MDKIVILDYGSQYNELLLRKLRDNGVYSLLLPKNIVWRASADRGRSDFGFFLCRPLPFCVLPYRSRPRSFYLISINKSSAQTGFPFPADRFGLAFGIGFACSVWTCSVVCTIIIAYFWDLSIPFLKIFLIFL